jgi:hypothetical protein
VYVPVGGEAPSTYTTLNKVKPGVALAGIGNEPVNV